MNQTHLAVLDRLTRLRGIRGAILVSAADGWVVAEAVLDGVDGRAAAAVGAALAGRLTRATALAGLRSPVFLHLRGSDGGMLAAPAGSELLVIAIVDPDVNIGLARLELLAAAGQVT